MELALAREADRGARVERQRRARHDLDVEARAARAVALLPQEVGVLARQGKRGSRPDGRGRSRAPRRRRCARCGRSPRCGSAPSAALRPRPAASRRAGSGRRARWRGARS
jgi:hypothetical protein